jgi:hypothetical protein
VYVHVGAPKTGTTYLQSVLWANRDLLAERGVLVPGGRRFAAFHAAQAIREVPWLADMPEGKRGVWDDMQRRIADWQGSAVLSHEFLGSATRTQARAALAALSPAQVHVVLTARDYTAVLPAFWQESVKMGARRRLDPYAASVLDGSKRGPWSLLSLDLLDVLDRWGDQLPAEQVHLVTVPPPGSPPGLLWRRFAQACQIDTQGLALPPAAENTSLTAVDIELIRQVAAHLPPSLQTKVRRHEWLRGVLAQQVLAGRPGQRATLSPTRAAQVREWSLRTIEEVRRRGYDVVGDLADLTCAPLPSASASSIARADVHTAALETIGLLLQRQRELVTELAHVRAQAEAAPTLAGQGQARAWSRRRRAPGQGSDSSTAAGAS